MTRPPPRVVMDTNIVLSALVFAQGRLAPLRLAWQQARFHSLASSATVAELMRVLQYPKFRLTREAQQELLADYLPFCSTVKIPDKPPPTPPCRDAHDVQFLELAVAGKASFLVTGDQGLLELTLGKKCAIVTAERFLSLLDPA
jgi:putative PIN family toxin of toxin-antitoxin system